ncbi:MAG: hypothetical protein CSA33_03590 [Desulfobulbus propionicus]|nr:MAG: hypothetical protein CSA33_03590 [Desulfobulbus propionicus]
MNIQIAQGCSQCGAPILVTENDRLIECPYCGVKNFLSSRGSFRYLLPPVLSPPPAGSYLMVPYIRFKGTIFMVSRRGITHKVVDTTQVASALPGLSPSLGVRPQAMKLQRLTAQYRAQYCPQSLPAQVILEKAVQISELTASPASFYHRAYIGENLSIIYLPLVSAGGLLYDAVTREPLPAREPWAASLKGRTVPFQHAWEVQSLASLCPHCGAILQGASDTLVLHCGICGRAWTYGEEEHLRQVTWQVQSGLSSTLSLPFWVIQARIPALSIRTLSDFIVRTNQPLLPREGWQSMPMRFVIPGFKIRPKFFLQAGKQGTLNQWRLAEKSGVFDADLFYPVTLSDTEALQSVKVILAACASSPQHMHPHLPKVRLEAPHLRLVYLPFQDRGHEWYQQEMGITIAKNILRFGRSM